MTLLVLGVLAFLLALTVGRQSQGKAPLFWVGCAYLVPAGFLAWTLFSSQADATRFRFALLGWGFRSEDGAKLSIPIGGDREAHPIWISALTDGPRGKGPRVGRLVFVPAPEDRENGELTVETAATTQTSGFLAIRRGRHSRFEAPLIEPIESLQIQEGDKLTSLGRTWTVRLDTGMFGPPARFLDAAGRPIDLPANYAQLPGGIEILIERPPPPGEKTYPVAWLEKAMTMTQPLPAGRPRAFFYRRADSYFGSSLWLAAPAGGVRVERVGQEVALSASAPLAAGDALHLVSFGHWNERGFPAGGMRDRRSFRIRTGRRGFALAFETPEIYVLPWSRILDLAVPSVAEPEAKALVRVNLSMGDWQITDKSLHFGHASRQVAAESLAILELPENLASPLPWGTSTFSAATPRGYQRGSLGEPTWLGGENRTAIQLDMISPPLGLAVLALLLALAKAVAARGARLTGAQLTVAAVLEILVSLRVLLGFRAWAMPPFSEEAYRLALVGWSLLPWAFLVACSPALGREDLRFRERLPALAGLLFSMAWCFRIEGSGLRPLLWAVCHVGAVFLLLRGPVLGWGRPLFRRASGLLARFTSRPVLLWTLAGCLPGLVRVGFLIIGAREGLRVGGQRFALTLLHVPLAVVLEAGYLVWLWRRVEDRGRLSWKDLLPGLAFVLGAWLGPAGLVSDNGLALLHVPVFLVALTALGFAMARRLAEEGGPGRGVAALPAVALLGYLLLAAFPVGARLLVHLFSERLELASERNYLRLLDFAYPQRLQEVGLRASEELAVMSAVMQSYTSRPFQECRYFSSVISPHIRATALREHATAVLISAEWSVAGAIGVALAYVALAMGALGLRPWRSDGSEAPGLSLATAQLAALTLAIPSLYMILANYRLTLFTGKNPYLLGLDSTADLLETLALAVLFALASAAVRAEEDA